MKDDATQKKLNKLARDFENDKKYRAENLLEDVIETMELIGGLSGFRVHQKGTLSLVNCTDIYKMPLEYEEHAKANGSLQKRLYDFLERLKNYVTQIGNKRSAEYHLGRDYASKHHSC